MSQTFSSTKFKFEELNLFSLPKLSVIMDIREDRLSYRATERKYNLFKISIQRWERIFLEEGAAGLMTKRRGRKSTGRPRKQLLDKSVEKDLIAKKQGLKEKILLL